MLSIGSVFRLPEVVFPEGAALAAGLWTLNIPPWACSRFRLLTLPPVCAALGVALENTASSLPGGFRQVTALVLGLAALQVTRSRLAPCVSAAMFPVVFGVGSWLFPISVAVICAVIAAGHAVGYRLSGRQADLPTPPLPPRWPAPLVGRYVLVSGAWILLIRLIFDAPAAMLSPPLFVAGLEWFVSSSRAPFAGVRRWLLLALAGLVGGNAALWPLPVAGAVAVAIVVIAAELLGDRHPPALAVCLIPFVRHQPSPLSFAAAVAVTAAALLLAGTVLRRNG